MAGRLQDVLLRGLFAARPLATAVAKGTLYYSTDVAQTHQSDGAAWNTFTDGGGSSSSAAAAGMLVGYNEQEDNLGYPGFPPDAYNTRIDSFGIVVDGGGVVITTGVKGFFSVPYDCTIIANRVLADIAGAIVFDIWKDIFANYPPTVADTITAGAKPTLAGPADHSEDTTLTGWTKSCKAGDVIGYNVDSATTVTRVTLQLIVLKN